MKIEDKREGGKKDFAAGISVGGINHKKIGREK